MAKRPTSRTNYDVVNDILPKRVNLKCKNPKQKILSKLITDNQITFCAGPAGVGKSYVAIARALELLQNKTNRFNQLRVCTPAVDVEENLGFLPGTVEEKLEPYVRSSMDIIDKLITKKARLKLMEEDIIRVEALGFLRGHSIDNSILVVEEAQNVTVGQMKMLITRIGFNSKFIITGDLEQSDRFRDKTQSGLHFAMSKLSNMSEVGTYKFIVEHESDIVRNPLIGKMLMKMVEPERVIPKVPKKDRVLLNEGVPEKKVTLPAVDPTKVKKLNEGMEKSNWTFKGFFKNFSF